MMNKSRELRFYYLIHNRLYRNFLCNVFIVNPILSTAFTYPTLYIHIYNIDFIWVKFLSLNI